MRRLALLTLLASLACVAALAGEAQAGVIQIAGGQAQNAGPDGIPCDPVTGDGCADDYYDVTGSLVGEWYTTSVDCRLRAKTGQCSGTELFAGFLDLNGNRVDDGLAEPDGTIRLTFTYSWSAAGNGRCHHPIVGGTEGFTNATGVVTMKDRLVAGVLVTTYEGHIRL